VLSFPLALFGDANSASVDFSIANDPILTSPARSYVVKMAPLDDISDFRNAKAPGVVLSANKCFPTPSVTGKIFSQYSSIKSYLRRVHISRQRIEFFKNAVGYADLIDV